MGGLVLGITVGGGNESAKPAVWHAERKLQLTVDERTGGAHPHYALQLRDLAQPPSSSPERAAPQLIGPPIVLTRDQPVAIAVVNRSKQPTAIPSHGFEPAGCYPRASAW